MQASGFRVEYSGFGVSGLGFRVIGCRVHGLAGGDEGLDLKL